MNPEERSKLIAKYNDGYSEVSDALKDFPAELLTARPLAGKWTACEIIHHLADSESTSAHRLRKLLVEDRPLIQGYDQDQFVTRARRIPCCARNDRPSARAHVRRRLATRW